MLHPQEMLAAIGPTVINKGPSVKTALTQSPATPRRLVQHYVAQPSSTVSNRAEALSGERDYLRLVPRDSIVAAVEALNERLGDERGEMQEYPDRSGHGPTLFRYTGLDGVQSAHSIPAVRLTSHVRALLWELAEAIEDEGRR